MNPSVSGDLDLDNISLDYRCSGNNWSDTWTTLSFDDFEDSFKNYNDGVDCSIYTD